MITADRLRELLHYDPKTGIFTWRVYRGTRWPGAVAGCTSAIDGKYTLIGADNGRYLAHRLAWLYMTGEWPEHEIDHRNNDGHDNRWRNLRHATRTQNGRNIRRASRNTSGYIGVYYDDKTPRSLKRWHAQIRDNDGKYKNLGRFHTAEEAARVRDEAARRLHGEFAVLNAL